MKVNEALERVPELIACYDVLKKLKDIFEDTFDGVIVPLSGKEVMSYNELLHFRDMNIKYLDKRINKIEKEIEKLKRDEQND